MEVYPIQFPRAKCHQRCIQGGGWHLSAPPPPIYFLYLRFSGYLGFLNFCNLKQGRRNPVFCKYNLEEDDDGASEGEETEFLLHLVADVNFLSEISAKNISFRYCPKGITSTKKRDKKVIERRDPNFS